MILREILHMTHGKNLGSILEHKGLWSKNHKPETVELSVDISHSHIQERRFRKIVPCGPRGNLHDYVPFYFGTRSPMLYAHYQKNVPSNPDGQRAIIYLVADAEETIAAGHPFVFTDGHAEMSLARFFDEPSDFNQLNWRAIHARYWKDTPEESARQFQKQAEFLVHRCFPLHLVRRIVTLDERIRHRVEEILSEASVQLPVIANPSWYYDPKGDS